ncbi:hypothetical protein B0F90DRAFT_1735099 [Multifurca ochricompacta]|uniref:Uncharacterized protein n=1 Tax=Multifurca ochricompacta TaxID=376703 RepID=A0AAD4QJK1_9AGAM|nr:hypothetical protein B0F90DRAFT_1735099 [Multifurca ochricompacta]
MDYDRKSAVSSFYGGRRSSGDALNRDYAAPPPTAGPQSRRDSSSSFFNPAGTGTLPRGAAEPAHVQNAGYNRMSYFDAGREEPVKGGHDEEEHPNEGGWDVFADFNNAGPRYSHAFGIGHNEASYQQLSPQLTGKMDEESSTQGPVEMVTVPALGAEWGKDELKDMTKRGRREKKSENFGRKWKAFHRGEYGLFGRKWLTRRLLVFTVFAICAVIGIVLAFVIPRVPGFSLNGRTPLVSATGWFNQSIPAEFNRAPANFSFPAAISLQVDTNSNFLPLVLKDLDAQVYDLDSFRLVGTGHLNHTKLQAKTFTNILMPLNFTYLATNDSDQTWNNWYNACKNKIQYTGGNRPGLRFRLNIDINVAGLPTKHSTATTVTNAPCPIELSPNAN